MPEQNASYLDEFIDIDDLDLADVKLENLDEIAVGGTSLIKFPSTCCWTSACACAQRPTC